MRFELTQRFTHLPREVDEAYADPTLYPTLVGLPKLGHIEVLEHQRKGDIARFAIRFAFIGDLPGAVTAVVDPERLTWVQQSEHHLDRRVTTFRLLPDHYPDRLSASGRVEVTSGDGGAQRVVAGELKVKAPLVAGRVENAIVSGLEEYLVAEAPAVDRFLGAAGA